MLENMQQQIKESKKITISALGIKNYTGIVHYYPEELIITLKAGTKITEALDILAKNQQTFSFVSDKKTMGGAYAYGNSDFSDSVLGVQIIDGRGDLLNFGGEVIKNVAGYDVSRLLVGSKAKFCVITQISFKVLPIHYVNHAALMKAKNSTKMVLNKKSKIRIELECKLRQIFDPDNKFNEN